MANEVRLIDADAFKMYLEQIRQEYLEEDTLSSNFAAEVIETVQDEYLKNAPAADVVPVVHGRWIIKSETQRMLDDFDEEFYIECPLCGRTFYIPFEFDDGKMLTYAKEKYPYCNCGVKMDGGNEDG